MLGRTYSKCGGSTALIFRSLNLEQVLVPAYRKLWRVYGTDRTFLLFFWGLNLEQMLSPAYRKCEKWTALFIFFRVLVESTFTLFLFFHLFPSFSIFLPLFPSFSIFLYLFPSVYLFFLFFLFFCIFSHLFSLLPLFSHYFPFLSLFPFLFHILFRTFADLAAAAGLPPYLAFPYLTSHYLSSPLLP